MAVFVDATTAQHTRGIRIVSVGVVAELAWASETPAVVAVGPTFPRLEGVAVRRIRMAGTRPGRIFYQRVLLPLDVEWASRKNGDLDRVLLLDSYLPAIRSGRRRYASLVHDVLPLTHPEYWSFEKLAVKRAAFSTLKRARIRVFTSSPYNARQVERLLGVSAHVVRFGCGQLRDREADDAARAPLTRRDPNLLYIGALEPRKDPLFLIDVFDRFAAEHEHRLVIVGGGQSSYVRSLRARIEESPYAARIDLWHDVDRETALRLIRETSALLFPSHAEGFGLPVLEALALGTPVVTRDLPEIRAWAADHPLYAGLQASEWVGAVETAIDASDERRRAGQEFARSYRWSDCARALIDF